MIYSKNSGILLDEDKEIIDISSLKYNMKYLSDITFSSNDYILNAILNMLPEKIIVHSKEQDDKFLETLKLIFGERLKICSECNMCVFYSNVRH